MFEPLVRAIKYAMLEVGKVYRYHGDWYALKYKSKKRVTLVLLNENDDDVRIVQEWTSDFVDDATERETWVVERAKDGHFFYGFRNDNVVTHTGDILIARTFHSRIDAELLIKRIGYHGISHRAKRINEWMSW